MMQLNVELNCGKESTVVTKTVQVHIYDVESYNFTFIA